MARPAAAGRRSTTSADVARVARDARGAAGRIRRFIARVHGAGPADDLILTPGVLVALRAFLAARRARRLVMSDQEYYEPSHFPELDVTVVAVSDLPRACRRARADAVLVSTVSYRGARLPIGELATTLRSNGRAPLVIADVTQSGAAGFPRVDSLGADVCCGDATKWITPITHPDRLGFVWFRDELRTSAQSIFGAFFQATATPHAACAARWLQPAELLGLDRYLAAQGLTRQRLTSRHRDDLSLARRLALELGVPAPDTAILWLEPDAARRLPEWARRRRLVWDFPDGSARVLCQTQIGVRPALLK